MKYLVMLILASTAFTFTAKADVNAEDVQCQTLRECKALKKLMKIRLAQVERRIKALSALPLEPIGPVERDDAGNVLFFSQRKAVKYCEGKHSRLPTAREYAKFGEERGARGIRETNDNVPWFKTIRGTDSAGNEDLFFYHPRGYVRPQGDIGNNLFWTLSFVVRRPLSAYAFSGVGGYFQIARRDALDLNFAVRCIEVR